ncbi:glycosyltransferase [Nocardioides sp.]|uniref:glycosyltransferase n=1 Tax=Nocardioides sp. TaxID=35761 RepID=UPI0037845925
MTAPRLTLVCAVLEDGTPLADLEASVEAQSSGLDDVEVVLVDATPPGREHPTLAEWARRRPGTVRVLRPDPAATTRAAARNAGIAAARGEWISFPDPDDALAPGYLAAVGEFLDAHPDADLVACKQVTWHEGTGQVRDDHPLRWMFRGSPSVDLADHPDRFHGHPASSFFRLDWVREAGLAFDPGLAAFDDPHFSCCYLLESARPRVGFLATARYRRRVRADASRGDGPGLPGPGHLDVVERARARHGRVPGWLATLLLHDLVPCFARTDSEAGEGRPVDGEAAAAVHRTAAALLSSFDPEAALPYLPPYRPPTAGLVLAHGYAAAPWREARVQLGQLDVTQELVRASYFFTGDLPAETWSANGTPITPLHAKVRDLTYYGRALLHERIVWLPADKTLTVDLDGVATDVVYERPPGPSKVAQPGQIRWWLNPESAHRRDQVPAHLRERTPESRLGRRALRLRDKPRVAERYAGAWVLMDLVRAGEGRTGVDPVQGRRARRPPGRPRVAAVAPADGPRHAPALLPRRRSGGDPRADPRVHDPEVAVPLPAARRHQGRHLQVAQHQDHGHVRGQHPARAGLDRG